ncbi:hypothetical protein MtrunA17_Chr4g0008131 [Medicago truncatula]|uniref:PAR1 protein n=1 Tax=Medicago truncatula TaxID=3880 RepID=G7JR79_MEDTR|nr:uncharacterized protein LOC11422489 [Medicago truncatula]AES86992.1 PAR1 protein [Medicago truncatula]RHN58967.1 hypothetical protein MtrunA17_Chr4g0008131 [Medicago truncatula]
MSFSTKLPLVLLLSSFLIHTSFAMMVCEDLPKEVCAFSVASSGKRCLLETEKNINGETEYQCRTSEVMVERIAAYIETDQCVEACGVDRSSVGISSDAFFEPYFTSKLCSPSCFSKCPNIVDLFFNLAAGEGVFLPELCEKHKTNPRRATIELTSSGAALGPASSISQDIALAPAAAPISEISEDNVPPQKQPLCEDSPLQLNVTACGQTP